MKEKLALVIAALMIASMAFAISTTTVSANGSATLTPLFTKDDTRVKFTVTVTNETSDNIDNVRIILPSGSGFNQLISSTAAADLKLAADNMENAVAPLNKAGENLRLAGDNLDDAGTALTSAATDLQAAANALNLLAPGWENNVASQIGDAATYLTTAGSNMTADPKNFTLIAEGLDNVASKLHDAAGNATAGEDMMAYDSAAAENLDNAAARLEDAANALRGGSLRNAGENLVIAGDNFENASITLTTTASSTVGSKMSAVGTSLKTAGQALKDAADYENYAGINLASVKNYLENAGKYIEQADDDLIIAGDNLENAALQIGLAADNMQASDDNILQAGDSLSQAALYLASVATQLGAALGGDELRYAKGHENAAAENLNVGGVDLGTAGDQLIAAASDLSAAASTMLSTANALVPATWNTDEDPNYVQFKAILDNVITPGSSETFVFLWTIPGILVENTYAITIASNKEGGAPATWLVQDIVTLTVDGKEPDLTIVVTQAGVVDKDGVAVNNVVGTVLNSAQATITITASETLQSIGAVTVENNDNFLPPITMTTTDNIVYTGTFTVENWDDNTVVVKVASAKDLSGLENLTIVPRTVTVDTRAPIFSYDGLATLVSSMGSKLQPGTGTTFPYVDNTTTQSLTVEVMDNTSTQGGVKVISVTINGSSATRSAVIENLWSFDPLTLSEGLNSIVTVTATDRTGNTVENFVENIFIDTQAPTIEFNTIAGKIWASGIRINDNTPEIKITVKDPGYPTTGLGIPFEKLVVQLDNNDNFLDGTPYWTLDNKDVWDNGLAGVFENIIDNARPENTYWVTVAVSDNLTHNGGYENQYDALRFIIDVTAPDKPDLDVETVSKDIDDPLEVTKATRTITGFAEVGSTITVYGTVIASDPTETVLDNDIVGSDGKWSVTITLIEGEVTRIQITATDVAGNESDRVTYGYLLLPIVPPEPPVDTTAPTVTITSPDADTTTDATSILLEATVTKDTGETYSELAVRIDATSLMAPITATNALSTDGELSRAVGLVEGTNTLSVSVMDASGNWSRVAMVTITRTVTPWGTYAIIIVIVALVLAAIAIFRKR